MNIARPGCSATCWTRRRGPRRSRSDFHQAQLQAETNEGLHKEGLVAALDLKLSEVRAEELKTRNALEKERLAIAEDAAKAQLEAARRRTSSSSRRWPR